MVPFERSLKMPLLPFEKDLIDQLGITAAEYNEFRREVMWRSRVRPAAYANVPDVQADALTISIISLVVGVLSSAASYLLTPKPQQPQQAKIRNRQLDNIVGRDRFAPTYGFQSGQDISRYGEAIPIVFTKQIPGWRPNEYIGGVMVSPKLVWSRLFSWGTYQSADLVFLVGQGRMGRGPYSTPAEIAADRAGIYIGQTPLDTFNENDYRWFYYQGGEPNANGIGYSSDSRLVGSNNRYGKLGQDFGQNTNAFYAPTFAGGDSDAFSHSYSPNNQLRFGAYNAIPNGTPLRLNWEVVSRLADYEDDAKKDANARRLQIAGNFRMEGTGRNYPRFIGITRFVPVSGNSQTAIAEVGNNGKRVDIVENGDKLELTFGGVILDRRDLQSVGGYIHDPSRFRQGSVDNESTISEIISELEKIDDTMQVGERFVIGNCQYLVTERTPADTFARSNKKIKVTVTLECEEVFRDGYIPNNKGSVGLVNETYVFADKAFPENANGPRVDIGQAWYPICQQDIATFQNVRQCAYTEIGIRSQVWLRFNGLTNFISIPGPEKLSDLDDRNIQVRGGTIQSYATRYSFFSIYIRSATAAPTDSWIRLNDKPLAIKGNAPRDLFNYLRIGHPLGQWEFRLRPLTSGELVQVVGRDALFVRLDTSENFIQITTNVQQQVFTLYTKGIEERIADIAVNAEMVNGRRNDPTDATTYDFNVILVKAEVNGVTANDKEVSNGIAKTINNDPDRDASEGVNPNVPWRSQTPEGGTYVFTDAEAALFKVTNGTKEMKLKMTLQSQKLPGPYNNNREWWWRIVSIEPIDISPAKSNKQWSDGETFQVKKQLFDGRDIVYTFRLNIKKQNQQVNVNDADRIFEANSAISEVSHYGGLITRSCDNNAEHEIVYVNESIDPGKPASYEGCAMAGIKIRSSRNLTSLEQLHIYQKNGIQVQRYIVDVDGRTQRNLGVGPSNLFTDLVRYLLLNKQAGLGSIFAEDLLDETRLRYTARFLETNRLYYDDVITEPANIRDFIASIAPSLLCNMVTRNGKFSLEPALPHHPDGSLRNPVLADVPIKAIFTEGNIIEDSFELRYLNAEERKPMKVALRYRSEYPDRFPEERTVVVSYNNAPEWSNAPLEEFNYTHITSYDHAITVARYFLAIRRYVTHTISFKTTPYGISLAPGDYIRVITQQNIYNATYNNGIILGDGTVVAIEPLALNQNHDVYLWERQNGSVNETSIFVDLDGKAFSKQDAIFAVRNSTTSNQTYVVESLQIDEDGLVQIVASHFPVISGNKSQIAEQVTVDAPFTIETMV